MVRNYSPEPVPPALLDRVVRTALRGPSAGFAQGTEWLVLDGPAEVRRYWQITAGERLARPDAWLRGMTRAPVVLVPFSNETIYRERYAEPDKTRPDGSHIDWLVPYWHLDAAMATMLALLAAVDEDLGACFFGVPGDRVSALREAFGVPSAYTPVGALTLGFRTADPGSPGSAATRRRRDAEELLHRGRW